MTPDRFRLTNAGADRTFGTADDIRYPLSPTHRIRNLVPTRFVTVDIPDGPLFNGIYHLEIDESVTDLAGNGLDGNNDSVAGGHHTRGFMINAVDEEAILESPRNNTFSSATNVPLIGDPDGTGWKKSPLATGALEKEADEDWWKFSAQSGDQIELVLQTEKYSRWDVQVGYWDVQLDVPVILDEISYLITDFSQSLVRFAPVMAPVDGSYFVRLVTKEKTGLRGFQTQRYDFVLAVHSQIAINVEDVSPDIEEEFLEPLEFDQLENVSHAVAVGSILKHSAIPADRDGYVISGVQTGQTISAWVKNASWSNLTALVTVIGPHGWQLEQAVLATDSDQLDVVARSVGDYRIVVNAFDGAALDAHYRLSVQVSADPVAVVLDVPASSIEIPAFLDPRSEAVLSWTTHNTGPIATQQEWRQHVYFLPTAGEGNRILLETFTVFETLAPDQSTQQIEMIPFGDVALDGARGQLVIETVLESSSLQQSSNIWSTVSEEIVFGEVLLPESDQLTVTLSSIQSNELHAYLIADSQTQVRFVGDWDVLDPMFVDGALIHRIEANGSPILFSDSKPWTNPIWSEDVDRSGSVTPLDALLIINQLARLSLSNEGHLDATSSDVNHYYYDTNGDFVVSPRDALVVINRLATSSVGNSMVDGESRSSVLSSGLVAVADDDSKGFANRIDDVITQLF